MKDGDGILCLNFRADRAREILAAFADPEFVHFETGPRPDFAIVSGFTEYSRRHSTYMDCIFPMNGRRTLWRNGSGNRAGPSTIRPRPKNTRMSLFS